MTTGVCTLMLSNEVVEASVKLPFPVWGEDGQVIGQCIGIKRLDGDRWEATIQLDKPIAFVEVKTSVSLKP